MEPNSAYSYDADFSHWEIKAVSANSSSSTSYNYDNGSGTAALYRTIEPRFYFYNNGSVLTYVFFRPVNTSGGAGAWYGVGSALPASPAGGDMMVQNKDSVEVTAIKTGGSGARNVKARYQESVVVDLVGGSALEDFAINISGRGFTAKPDIGTVQVSGASVSDFRKMGATYVYDHGSNTSSTAYVTVFRLDGGNLADEFVRLSIEFIEYD